MDTTFAHTVDSFASFFPWRLSTGLGSSNAAGPGLVARVAETYVDTMYKA